MSAARWDDEDRVLRIARTDAEQVLDTLNAVLCAVYDEVARFERIEAAAALARQSAVNHCRAEGSEANDRNLHRAIAWYEHAEAAATAARAVMAAACRVRDGAQP